MKKIKDPEYCCLLKTYYSQIRHIPLLTFEEELELSRRIQSGDEAARRRMIEANLRLVLKITKRYLVPGVSLMDLIQEGNIGLMRAVDKYDHRKQVRFATYANPWIRQSVYRYLADKRRTIRLPHKKEETLRKVQAAESTLNLLFIRQPSLEEISAETGISKEKVKFILGIAPDATLLDLYGDQSYCPEREFIKKSSQEATLKVLNQLKNRDKNIIIYRYRLNGGKYFTLRSIGKKMGISMEAVRQAELRALRKLKPYAEDLRVYLESS